MPVVHTSFCGKGARAWICALFVNGSARSQELVVCEREAKVTEADTDHDFRICVTRLPQGAWWNGTKRAPKSQPRCRSWRHTWATPRLVARIGTFKPYPNCSSWRPILSSLRGKEGRHENCQFSRVSPAVFHRPIAGA